MKTFRITYMLGAARRTALVRAERHFPMPGEHVFTVGDAGGDDENWVARFPSIETVEITELPS